MKFTSYLSRKQALNLQNTIFRCQYSDTTQVKKYVGKEGILKFCHTIGFELFFFNIIEMRKKIFFRLKK